jgi:2-polyprenyl-3-methyl-5-hydroxy-6-metoxy-1,4-benzoquinol methylase
MGTRGWRTLIDLDRRCRRLPIGRRLHVLGRFLTCPFLEIVEEIPCGTRLLDIGAGHGLLAHLAAADGSRRVVALEPDLRKSLPSFRCPGVRFVAGFDQAIGGRFDVVTMIDVLYKVPVPEWDALFARVRDRLVPGGMFLLKELDPERRVKAAWNRAQEALASAAKLTLGRAFSYESREQLRCRIERAGFVHFRTRDLGGWYPHAHVLYSALRPAE